MLQVSDLPYNLKLLPSQKKLRYFTPKREVKKALMLEEDVEDLKVVRNDCLLLYIVFIINIHISYYYYDDYYDDDYYDTE